MSSSSNNSKPLTRRETQVARHLARGVPDNQIARRLCISPHTARNHVRAICDKYGARNRIEAAYKLGRSGCC